MPIIDVKRPVRLTGEDDQDYIMRYGSEVIRANRLYIQAIEKMPVVNNPTTNGPKGKPVTNLERQRYNRETLVDFLNERPHLAAKHKAGKWDPFEV